MDFLKELSKKLQSKYDYLKLLKVVYNTTFSLCHVNFIYPEDKITLTDEQKDEIKTAVAEILNIKGKITCKFNKSYLDEKIIKNKIDEFFKTYFNSLYACIDLNQIKYQRDNFCITLEFNVNKTLFAYLEENDIKQKLKIYLCENFCSDFVIIFKQSNALDFDEMLLETRAFEIQSQIKKQVRVPRYKVENLREVFGGEIMPMPEYIKDQKQEKQGLILAGTVKNLEQREYLPKKNKEKGIDEKRKMYKFTLDDGSSSIKCVHFCNKSSEKHFVLVEENSYIVCQGMTKKQENNKLDYIIKAISLCKKSEQEQDLKQDDQRHATFDFEEGYKFVFPKPYEKLVQNNLFEEKIEYPDFIKNNKFVVFDVETTGISPDRCDITEIGSVKIENGKITQIFQTLCKPHAPIPKEVINLTGITNEMVENERYSEEVISDFYNFCKDCIMVGYNVSFDQIFIQTSARRINKYFDNEFKDCMADARSKLILSNYKLKSVVSALNLELNNAHRALYDATATAEAYLKLSTMPNLLKK